MQAARRVLTSVGILQRMTTLERRGMTTAAQLAADAAKPKGSLVDQLGVYILTPIALGVFAYDVWIADEVRHSAAAGLRPRQPLLCCLLLFPLALLTCHVACCLRHSWLCLLHHAMLAARV
jgi:hypothetical protein